jgi:hypothetical protein
MVQSTPPTYSRDGMPLFSDPRFTEHLYHYQCRYLNDTTHRVDRIAPQVDHLQQDLREMSANFSFLRNTFQHFVDMHFVPLQDHIFPSGPPTLNFFCECPLSRLTRDILIHSSPQVLQVRTDDSSLRSPLSVNLTVPIQSPSSIGSSNPPPLESVTDSSINTTFHTPDSSAPLPVCPPQVDTSVRPYWAQDSDSELSEEESPDGNSVDSEEVGEEFRERYSASGIRNDSV